MREIGEPVGLTSSSSVAHQLRMLEDKGFLKRDPNRPRALCSGAIASRPMTTADDDRCRRRDARCHRTSRWWAGSPPVARSWPRSGSRRSFRCRKCLVGDGTLFLLEVSGDSMIDAAICNGDYVVIRQEPTAGNGEVVAAMLDGEATVKTFERKNGQVWLVPHNAAYDPIDGDQAQILGIVTAVLRRV